MKGNSLCRRRLWICNKGLVVLLLGVMACSQTGIATTLIVIVSGTAVVFGADGKSVDAGIKNSELNILRFGSYDKIAIIQDRIFVSTTGVSRIAGFYNFNDWLLSLPIKKKTTVEQFAGIIKKKCRPIFNRWWSARRRRGDTSIPNLSGDKSLPIVSYYVGSSDSGRPEVYMVAIYVDWINNKLNRPMITRLFPPVPEPGTTEFKNIFVWRTGAVDGGMAQFFTDGTEVNRKYLALYNKTLGAAIYDEPLDADEMIKLARILLTLEIETNPARFSFPIKICSAVSSQKPTCNSYNK